MPSIFLQFGGMVFCLNRFIAQSNCVPLIVDQTDWPTWIILLDFIFGFIAVIDAIAEFSVLNTVAIVATKLPISATCSNQVVVRTRKKESILELDDFWKLFFLSSCWSTRDHIGRPTRNSNPSGIFRRWCQGLFRPKVPWTAQLLTLHQHRANSQLIGRLIKSSPLTNG